MGRSNYMVTNFTEIALEQFYWLQKKYERLKAMTTMNEEVVGLCHGITNHYTSCITFSAMALEAFFNDYAATKLGDDFYYDNFENLRPFSKLQLISLIIFNETIDKSGNLFRYINLLFKERNKLVHCKSRELRGMSKAEYMELEHLRETNEDYRDYLAESMLRIDMKAEEEMRNKAHDALKALVEVAAYFDKHDVHAFASYKLLCSGAVYAWDGDMQARIKDVQLLLGVRTLVDASEL